MRASSSRPSRSRSPRHRTGRPNRPFAIDPIHTFVTFEINHFGASVNWGRFDKKKVRCSSTARVKTGKVEIRALTPVHQRRHPGVRSRTCKAPTCSMPHSTRKSQACPDSSASTATGQREVSSRLTLLGKTSL